MVISHIKPWKRKNNTVSHKPIKREKEEKMRKREEKTLFRDKKEECREKKAGETEMPRKQEKRTEKQPLHRIMRPYSQRTPMKKNSGAMP